MADVSMIDDRLDAILGADEALSIDDVASDDVGLEAAEKAFPGGNVSTENPYIGVALKRFDDQAREILNRPFDDSDVEVLPSNSGAIYIPGALYRERLNEAFGQGGWALVKLKRWHDDKDNNVYFEGALYVGGRYVAEAIGGHAYKPGGYTSLSDAVESAKTNCLVRCCKDLGIGAQVGKPQYIREWRKLWGVRVWVENQKDNKKSVIWRRADADPIDAYPLKETGIYDAARAQGNHQGNTQGNTQPAPSQRQASSQPATQPAPATQPVKTGNPARPYSPEQLIKAFGLKAEKLLKADPNMSLTPSSDDLDLLTGALFLLFGPDSALGLLALRTLLNLTADESMTRAKLYPFLEWAAYSPAPNTVSPDAKREAELVVAMLIQEGRYAPDLAENIARQAQQEPVPDNELPF